MLPKNFDFIRKSGPLIGELRGGQINLFYLVNGTNQVCVGERNRKTKNKILASKSRSIRVL